MKIDEGYHPHETLRLTCMYNFYCDTFIVLLLYASFIMCYMYCNISNIMYICFEIITHRCK